MQEFIDNCFIQIADNVKKIRLENNLSQESFAEKICCSREYVSRLENYKEKISLPMMLKISFVFGVDPKNFFVKGS